MTDRQWLYLWFPLLIVTGLSVEAWLIHRHRYDRPVTARLCSPVLVDSTPFVFRTNTTRDTVWLLTYVTCK